MDGHAVEARLEKLERDNRRLRMAFGAVLLAIVAVVALGAVSANQIPDVIEAHAFRVRDENGTARVAMGADGIFYWDENGTMRASMVADGILYWDENGTGRASMGADGISYRDEDGTTRAIMDADGISYLDEDGNTRAKMGAINLVTPATGAETRYPALFALYNADGTVLWQALRR